MKRLLLLSSFALLVVTFCLDAPPSLAAPPIELALQPGDKDIVQSFQFIP